MPFHQSWPEIPTLLKVLRAGRLLDYATRLSDVSLPTVILSIREKQIVRLLMSGKTNKEIGRAINISERRSSTT